MTTPTTMLPKPKTYSPSTVPAMKAGAFRDFVSAELANMAGGATMLSYVPKMFLLDRIEQRELQGWLDKVDPWGLVTPTMVAGWR